MFVHKNTFKIIIKWPHLLLEINKRMHWLTCTPWKGPVCTQLTYPAIICSLSVPACQSFVFQTNTLYWYRDIPTYGRDSTHWLIFLSRLFKYKQCAMLTDWDSQLGHTSLGTFFQGYLSAKWEEKLGAFHILNAAEGKLFHKFCSR